MKKYYKSNEYPSWLNMPVVETEVINNLSNMKQDTREILKIYGVAPSADEQKAKDMKK